MGYFVTIDENNFVNKVSTINNNVFTINNIERNDLANDFLNNLYNTSYVWLQTSYNTRGGIHYEADNNTPSQDQSKAFRKNYAGIGYYYDSIRDAFIPPKPFPSWTLNEETCLWQSPIPYPNDGKMYQWNEETGNWDIINF
jgi:catalase (peroxidase I)